MGLNTTSCKPVNDLCAFKSEAHSFEAMAEGMKNTNSTCLTPLVTAFCLRKPEN